MSNKSKHNFSQRLHGTIMDDKYESRLFISVAFYKMKKYAIRLLLCINHLVDLGLRGGGGAGRRGGRGS